MKIVLLFSSSSSLEQKSKIKIERLEGVVKPNVSPGKNNSVNGDSKSGQLFSVTLLEV